MDEEKKELALLPPPKPEPVGGPEPDNDIQIEIERLKRTVRELQHKVGRDRETMALWREFQPKFMEFMVDMLEVLDNFERAEDAARGQSPIETVAAGLSAVRKQMLVALSRRDIVPFGKAGDPLHLELHQPLEGLEPSETGNFRIAEVLRPGYKLGDAVLRKAWVRVEPGPEDAD